MRGLSMDIVEFLRARLDEDEAQALDARKAANVVYPNQGDDYTFKSWGDDHPAGVVIVGPARVLREVEARRRIVELHATVDPCDAHDGATLETVTCDTLLVLAAVYADHPDCDPEWR